MPKFYTLDEAASYLQVPRKHLDNYIKIGHELKVIKIGRKNMLASNVVQKWKTQRDFGSVILNKSDYIRCLDFTIRSFYQYRSKSNFGSSTQRDAGKFINDFVIGKLGEIAVEKFMKKNFDIDVRLDFEIRDSVIGQDITEFSRPRKKGVRVFNPPKSRVAIKTSKLKNVWLIVSEKEVTDPERTSDIYIFSRVELHPDHLIRLLKEHTSLANIHDMIPEFGDIVAEVCGFIEKPIFIRRAPTKILPDQDQVIGSSYICRSGELKRSITDWNKMIATL